MAWGRSCSVHSFAFLLSASICLFMFFIHCYYFRRNKIRYLKKTKKLPPPGQLGLPWIGETIDFFRAQRRNRLFEDFVHPRILKHGNIFKTRLMGSPTVVVNGADANHFFLTNEFKLVISSWPSSSVQLMGKHCIMEKQGESHRFLRGIIAATLSGSSLESIVPKLCNSVLSHLENNWSCPRRDKVVISLYRVTKKLTFAIVFECLLGIIDVEPWVLGTFERVLEGVFAAPIKFPGSKFCRAKSARREIEKMLVDVVRRKRMEMEKRMMVGDGEEEEEEETLLSRLVGGLIGGEISEEEVVDNVILLVFAAHDTTTFAIAMTFRMLAHHPDCYSQLLQEHVEIMNSKRPGEMVTLEDTKKMKYTWQVAKESMRLFPPIFGSFRKAIQEIEYKGFTIPRGWKVLWTAYGTHYNEEYFRDPLAFNPSRFDEDHHHQQQQQQQQAVNNIPAYAFLPFGGGPRVCAGFQLAKLNILVFVHYVVIGYDWSLLYPDEPITMDPLPFPSLGMPVQVSHRR